ncbi:MAG: ribulose-phosphate 3-epimerase [Eubacterium sp.]|jgi:ribulose-phosphate 3-epimerase|nr:ribulose-phosphate 3-epimerase [Eubacterium sp.]
MKYKISASVLNSDMSELGKEVRRVEQAGAHMLHLDVMDGVFVRSITFGDYMQNSLRKHTNLVFDTHLMVYDPTGLIPLFVEGGSDIITIHKESNCDTFKTLRLIREFGVKSGLSIKPGTSAESVFPYLKEADMILVMTVEPGYGGQGFMLEMLEKVRTIRAEANRLGVDIDIEVDGGINGHTAKISRDAGANVLVAGSYLFKNENMKSAVSSLLPQK